MQRLRRNSPVKPIFGVLRYPAWLWATGGGRRDHGKGTGHQHQCHCHADGGCDVWQRHQHRFGQLHRRGECQGHLHRCRYDDARVAPSDSGVILSTGRATDITNSKGDANLKAGTSTNHKTAGDADLEHIAGGKTFDAAVLNAEFVPQGSSLTMQVTFSSEEYLEYSSTAASTMPSVSGVNGEKGHADGGRRRYHHRQHQRQVELEPLQDNPAAKETLNTEMDGVTVTLTLKAAVIRQSEHAQDRHRRWW